ncbi:MAG: septation protein SpoVG family protein [Melioribacteraceae bacterium]
MKIARINPLQGNSNSKTAAFFDFQTDDGILIKGFRIVSGANGLFIASPSEKGKDGKYYDSIVLPKEMKDELQKMAITEFNVQN